MTENGLAGLQKPLCKLAKPLQADRGSGEDPPRPAEDVRGQPGETPREAAVDPML
jgi:hypothetical protein